jgi:protein-disulfide isomerase
LGPRIALAGDSLHWDQLVGIETSTLSKSDQQRVQHLCDTITNTYGCKSSITACVAKGDMTARRHAGFIARMVKKGKDDGYIKKHIALRYDAVHPKEKAHIDLANHPPRGNPNAKVVLVEFACFQCPFCAHLAPDLKVLSRKYGDKLVQYYKFFPVRSHPEGVPAAIAAMAAHKQGKFWQMYQILFENRANLKTEDQKKYAKRIGLDVAQWKKDMASPDVMSVVEKDKLEGMRLGVNGTPTFFINGKRYDGVHDLAELDDRIAEELDILEGRIR